MNTEEILRWAYRGLLNGSAIGLWFWLPRWKHTYWKWLPLYVSFIALGEWTGFCLRSFRELATLNSVLYSFVIHPATFVSLFWVFGRYDKEQKRPNNLWLAGTLLFLLTCIADYYFIPARKFWFHSLSYLTGSLILCVLLVRFFVRFIFSNRITRFRSDIMFWFSCTLLVYYMGTFPFFALRNTLAKHYYDELFLPYWYVQIILSGAMYCSFFILYACTKPK